MKKTTLKNFCKKLLLPCLALALCAQLGAQTAKKPAGSGTETDPYKIESLENLHWLSKNSTEWGKHYAQTADIDATPTKTWDEGKGFSPIGDETTKFTGSYRGKGHLISNLFINRPTQDYVGLFGFIQGTSTYLDSLGIIEPDITGHKFIGSLSGKLKSGKILFCFSYSEEEKDNIKGNLELAGGLTGHLSTASVSYSYNTCNIKNNSIVGGIAGAYSGNISNCYSTGSITAENDKGGIAGEISGSESLSSCFWDIETSGLNTSAGGTGLSTQEMKTKEKFTKAGWDFVGETANGSEDIWAMNPHFNKGYPFLSWQWRGPLPMVKELPTIYTRPNTKISEMPKAHDIMGNTLTATTDSPLSYEKYGTYTITWTYTESNGKSYTNTSTQTQTVVVNSTGTGIGSIAKKKAKVWPNPASGTIYFKAGENQIKGASLTSLEGKTVARAKQAQQGKMNISHLPKGTYILRVETNKGAYTQKVNIK